MRKWTRQPPAGTPIDWSNPYTKDLFFVSVLRGEETPIDLVNNVRATIQEGGGVDSISTKVTRYGVITDFERPSSESNYQGFSFGDTGGSGIYEPTAITMFARCRPEDEAHSGGSRVVSKRTTAIGSDDWAFYADTVSEACDRIVFRTNGANLNLQRGSGSFQNTLIDIVGRCDANVNEGYVYEVENGDALTTNSGTGKTLDTGTGDLCIGIRDSEHRQFDGEIHLVALWSKAKSESFIKGFRANPWQIFKPRKQFILADVPDDVRFLPVEKPWKKQPPANTPIDWGNPLTKSMVACFVFNEESGNLRDRVKGRSITTGGTPDRITTPQGLAHAFGGTSDRYVVPNSSELDATGDFTVVVGFTNQEVGQNVEIVEKQSGNPMWQIYNAATGNNLEFYGRDSAGTLITLDSVTTLDVGKYVQAAGVKSVANDRVYLYINGYLEDDVEDTSTGDWSNTADMLIADGSAAGMFNGYIHYLYIFQDAKDAEQIARIHENPWQIFKPQIIHAPADVALPDLATFEKWR